LDTKLWVWMLEKANHKDGYKGLKRGQFFTTIDDMREAMSYHAGYRKLTPSRKEIRKSYERFFGGTMIDTTKVTHGMVITVLNYDHYQNPKNYEGHNEGHNEIPTKVQRGAQYKQEGKEGQKRKLNKDPRGRVFQEWWMDKYQYKFSKEYIVTSWPKFGSQIKSLLKLPLSFEDLQYLAIEFFMDNDPFIVGSDNGNGTGHNIGMFITRISQNSYKRYLDKGFREENRVHIVNESGEAIDPGPEG